MIERYGSDYSDINTNSKYSISDHKETEIYHTHHIKHYIITDQRGSK